MHSSTVRKRGIGTDDVVPRLVTHVIFFARAIALAISTVMRAWYKRRIMNSNIDAQRNYWVVSPNIDEGTVEVWRNASVQFQVAFMGWPPYRCRNSLGPKFAGLGKNGIKPGDVILIARRNNLQAEIVGFGVVQGEFITKVNGFKPPEGLAFGSARKLNPFKVCNRSPDGIAIINVLGHTKALRQLHPQTEKHDKKVCAWLDRQLEVKTFRIPSSKSSRDNCSVVRKVKPLIVEVVGMPENPQLDYAYQTKEKKILAQKDEAGLLEGYKLWLKKQGRILLSAKYGRLRCDGFESKRNNLIEAKASSSREHIRMAVGQLLDYSFQGKKKFGKSKLAVLLPKRPSADVEAWLDYLKIKVIWREKDVYLDNSNGQF